MRIGKQTVLYGAMILGISGIVLQLLNFVYRVLLSRLLGAEGMGVYQLVFPFSSMVIAISMSGIGVGVTSLSARFHAVGNADGNKHLMHMALFSFLAFFVALAVPTVLFVDFIAKDILGDSRTRTAILVMLPCIFFTGFENIYKSFFHGIRKVHLTALSEQLEFYIRIAFVAMLAFSVKPADTSDAVALVVLGMLISEVFSSGFLANLYKREMRCAPRHTQAADKLGMRLARIAIPATLTGVLSHLLGSANTLLLPRRLVESGLSQSAAVSTLGVYLGMATPLLMLPMAISGPLAVILLPKLSTGLELHNLSDVRRKIGKAVQAISLAAVPFILLLIPLGPALCSLLFGQSVSEGSFALIATSAALTCYQIVLSSALNGIGLPRRNVVHVVIGGCIQLAFTYYVAAMPQWGIFGYLAGSIASALCIASLSLWTIRRKVNLRVRFLRWIVLPVTCAGIAGFCCRLLFLSITRNHIANIVDVLVAFSGGGPVYLLTLWLQGIHFFRYMRTLMPKSPG